ncbi:hypothetical protein FHR81_003547 [Actinoalloteichus hoggarensis]|uniref:Uncharacterized protein n=1 Tax=Actinoalloteichus hoggarensis TaxID=1470176 RepID=A0A221W7L7_9PSEU|nr:hypothetical protein [Actinoalloteichus hoggarensis]ASO21898.1 hypothetical protein AHOG_21410 [Actinoalloteichus hoggarensis]MBB5922495.1 hypothetical protein [Actinoalloteichus hoggarensis]
MNTVLTIAVVVVLILAALVAGFVLRERLRRARLRRRFGPEYERLLAESPDHRAVERELTERERRHADLNVRPASAEMRRRYTHRWTEVQGRFVDSPGPAVMEADRLITSLMAERGYPTEGYRQQVTDLSVDHGRSLEHYREAHRVLERGVGGEAATEDLRLAMRHYRALFEDLLGDEQAGLPSDGDATAVPSPDPAPAPRPEARPTDARHPA